MFSLAYSYTTMSVKYIANPMFPMLKTLEYTPSEPRDGKALWEEPTGSKMAHQVKRLKSLKGYICYIYMLTKILRNTSRVFRNMQEKSNGFPTKNYVWMWII